MVQFNFAKTIPDDIRQGMEEECEANDGFTELRFDGYVGTSYLLFEDWWRTIYTYPFMCNATNVDF